MAITSGTKIGRYEIRSKIGAGGMGEVYLAQDTTELGRTVAIKVLSAEVASDPKRMQRFVQEAKTVSALNHPNILTIYEFGQDEATRFIATEFVDGVTLREFMRARSLKLHEVLDIAAQMAAALDAAHEAHVAHRDIKPENIMVRRRDTIVKVLDFGLAKLSEPPMGASGPTGSEDATRVQMNTEPGVVMGTVSYMSPEQTRGLSTIDQRTDIWSLGAVLYELVAGRVPFEGKDVHRQIIAIQEQDLPPLSRFATGVPERLEDIVAKALAKEPNERYQTAKDLLIDLRNLKRKLEVDAEIDRTISPEVRTAASTSGQFGVPPSGGEPSSLRTSPPEGGTPNTRASSAEYVVSGIKQHKLAAVAVVAVLVVGAAVLFLFLRGRENTASIQSIAVLPFENRSGSPDTEYLSDGLADSLIYRLSQLPNLKVSPTSSVMRYKGKETDVAGIAKELQVDAVMSGRLMQRGDDLSISVQLIDARSGKLIWAEQYERKMSDLLATQREIASAIAQRLQLKLAGNDAKGITKKYTNSNEAYQLYMKGRYYFARRTKEDVEKAIESYKQAIDLDPNFAIAYARLAEAYNQMPAYPYSSPQEAFPLAKAAATRALEIDPNLSEGHTALANTLAAYDWNWPEAEREFKRALELDPNSATAHFRYGQTYLAATGQLAAAIDEMNRAIEMEPLDANMSATAGWWMSAAGQRAKALELGKKSYDLDPNHPVARNVLTQIYLHNGMNAEALAFIEQNRMRAANGQWELQNEGVAYAKLGRRSEAEGIIGELRTMSRTQYVVSYYIASIDAALGDRADAFTEMENAFKARDWRLLWLKSDPFMDPLRDDQRFKSLVKRMNLPE